MDKHPMHKTARLPEYNYASPGAYYVTICTNYKQKIFGEIVNGKMCFSEYGRIANNEIVTANLIRQSDNIRIAKYVVMPNHVHMIVEIIGTGQFVPEVKNQFSKPIPKSLSQVVGSYKSAVTRQIHLLQGSAAKLKVWQPGFYERIIRNEWEYRKKWEYIENNPLKWEIGPDEYYK